jgi:hypothetical protein
MTAVQTKEVKLVEVDSAELDRLRRVDEQLKLIENKEVIVRKLKDDWDRKKDAALAAKKLFDEADAELRDLIAAKEDSQMRLPFGTTQAAGSSAAEEREPAPITTGWEAVPLAELKKKGLGNGVAAKLVAFGIKTIGAFEARRRDHGRSLDIPGIGEKLAAGANDALDDWLAENRDKAVFDAARAGGGLSVVSPDEDEAPRADGRYFKLAVEIKAGEAVYAAGSIHEVAEELGDGRIALMVRPGADDVFSVQAAEGSFVSVTKKVKVIRVVRPVLGDDTIHVGDEFEVLNWLGQNAIVRMGEAEKMIAAAEFEAVNPELIEVASVEDEAAADATGE